MKVKSSRMSDMHSESNTHAELIRSLTSPDYVPLTYLSVQVADHVMENRASEYVLRLAARLRILMEKQLELKYLIAAEFSTNRREHLIENEFDLGLEIDLQTGLYFLELSKEQRPLWRGVPMFTLRSENTVVISGETNRAYKKLLVKRQLSPYDLQEFLRRLILSPLATVADLPDLSPQKL